MSRFGDIYALKDSPRQITDGAASSVSLQVSTRPWESHRCLIIDAIQTGRQLS